MRCSIRFTVLGMFLEIGMFCATAVFFSFWLALFLTALHFYICFYCASYTVDSVDQQTFECSVSEQSSEQSRAE